MKNRALKAGSVFLIAAVVFAMIMVPGAGTVDAQAKKISISQKTAYLAKGDTLQLKIKNVKASKVRWKSGNKKVATVSSKGLVKAKKTGKATITARVGGKKYTCKVVVEKKSVNRARRLRDYVLKKGEEDQDTGLTVLEKELIDEEDETVTRLSVGATEDSKKLTFTYYVRPDAPDEWRTLEMKINLISGKSKVKKGKITYNYQYPDDWTDFTYYGTIVTDAGEDAETLCSLKKIYRLEYGYDEETGEDTSGYETITDCAGYNDELETLTFNVGNAFDAWDAWFASVKSLKKYKISMKSMGFDR